jgi:hypothetical protein
MTLSCPYRANLQKPIHNAKKNALNISNNVMGKQLSSENDAISGNKKCDP